MGPLSFLIVHGAAVWQTIVLLATVGGLAAAALLAGRAMRGRAARARGALGEPAVEATLPDVGKVVTLTGTLVAVRRPGERDVARGEGGEVDARAVLATLVPQGLEHSDELTPKARSASAYGAELAIETAGGRIVLRGDTQVVAGSRETERCVAAKEGRALLWAFAGELGASPARPFAIRTLREGDRVIARGLLRREPEPDQGGGYRAARATYALENDPADPQLPAISLAYAADPRLLVRPYARTLLRAAAVPFAAVVGLVAIGEMALRASSPTAWTVAAATPLRRADALAELRAAVPLRTGADHGRVERAAALDLVRGRCGDAADDLYEHQALAESAKTASACGDALREARAFMAMAEFERAADAFERARASDPKIPPSLTEATAYVIANKRPRAVAALRALERSDEGGSRMTIDHLECAALALEADGDHPAAAATLEETVERQDGGVCAALRADMLHGPARGKFVESRGPFYYQGKSMTDWGGTLRALLAEDGRDEYRALWGFTYFNQYVYPSSIVFTPRDSLYFLPPALAESVVRERASRTDARSLVERAQLLLGLARFDAYLGEIPAARDRVSTARDVLTSALAAVEADRAAEASLTGRATPATGRVPGSFGEYVDGLPVDAAEWQQSTSTLIEMKDIDVALDIRGATTGRVDRASSRHVDLNLAYLARTTSDLAPLRALAERDTRDVNHRLWDFALDGDGPRLVQRLEEKSLDGRGVVDFLDQQALLRPELARWVRYGYPTPCATCGLYPLANQIASRRDAAVAAGASDVVEETAAAARRVRAVLLRRDIAMILAVLGDLSPP